MRLGNETMSANPQNANLGLKLAENASAERRQNLSSGREALQALLAFSSLHEQIRQRRAIEAQNGRRLTPEDAWQLEQFVLDEVLHLVAERAQTITGADGIAIALADGEAVVCRASVGVIVPDPGVRLNPDSGFSGTCFRSGEIVRCDDTEQDPRVNVQTSRQLGARSMVAVPLLGQKSIIGLIEAFSTEAYAFNDSDVRSLSLLAELILAAIKPEEEDRMAEISQQVSATSADAVTEENHEATESKPESEVSSASFEPQFAFSPTVQETEKTLEAGQPISPAEVANDFPLPVEEQVPRPVWFVIAVLLAVAVIVGLAAWWILRRPVSNHPTIAARALETERPITPPSDSAISTAPVAKASKTSGPSQVVDVRHWSTGESSTVVIDLRHPIQYEAHRLTDPDRIYFDLYDTSLAASWIGKVINVDDAHLQRIRMAQSQKNVTRIVLDTKGTSKFSVSLEQNPSRLVVQVSAATSPQSESGVKNVTPPSSGAAVQKQGRDKSIAANVAHASFTIVLDAGHGGWDLGSVGQDGLLEKDLVLDIVQRLGKLVQSRLKADVIYTRQDDTYVSLERRAEIANLDHANLFVSVHANYSGSPDTRGVETYYSNTYSSTHARTPDTDTVFPTLQTTSWSNVDIRVKTRDSRQLADDVQNALYGALATKSRSLPDRGVKQASYAVLVGTTMPAVLAEVSFVSSPADAQKLKKEAYRQKIAQALYAGIASYAKHTRFNKLASMSSLSPVR